MNALQAVPAPLRRRYVARGLDWSTLTEHEKNVLLPAMDMLYFPTVRIKKKTGKKVPIVVSDLSRFAGNMDANGHGHVHEGDEHAHLLGLPEPKIMAFTGDDRAVRDVISRRAPLGLYWLPTPQYPAGRIEIHSGALNNPDLAREVLIAEIAHAVDYGAMTDSQRARINRLFEHTGHEHTHDEHDEIGPDEWFEGHEGGYWAWPGERFMALFMAAYAPTLPRPLEARQPWTHTFDESDVKAVRRILRRPSS